MSKHLFALIITPYGTAANNRGENDGNITTLQKLLWKNETHTTVSAEAIRWALRYHWQQVDENSVNRVWDDDKSDHKWRDRKWLGWNPDVAEAIKYVDDDVLGFMEALAASKENDAAYAIPQRRRDLKEAVEAAAEEGDEKKIKAANKKFADFEANLIKLEKKWQEIAQIQPDGKDDTKQKTDSLEKEIKQIRKAMDLKGITLNRRGALEVTRAISLSPFAGDITFNAKSGKKGNTSLYGTELHSTRYQYGLALTPKSLHPATRALEIVDAVINLREVGGNHSRFLFDFSPDSVVFRWTDDFAPRMLYGFEMDAEGRVSFSEVIKKIESGDILPGELFIGGKIAETMDQETREKLNGAVIHPGIKAVADELKQRMSVELANS
mgnify:CR=1 FL=1